MSLLTEEPQTDAKITVARFAASKADSLREQARSLNSEALAPLRRALQIRAGELELAAAVLGDEPLDTHPRLRAIA
jgi:hypothetical protein